MHRKFQQATSRARDPIVEGHENSLCKCRRRLASVASSFQVKQVKRGQEGGIGCSVNKGLVTNYGGGGGATKREGACDVLPLRKEGGRGGKSFSHAEGGEAQQVLG